MKSRAFVGSSVEGLNVAYSVQQNLMHDAEVTVWDQGVFELSTTTIESLTKKLGENDFGIFVFSPDDLVKMRSSESPAVRDNVVFEFGLFIGRLGRDRVFFLLPNSGELHLPSDLLGVTAGRYDAQRSDGSMQAATGPACHQIRQQIKSLGPLPGRMLAHGGAEEGAAVSPESRPWIQDFLEERYGEAIKTLEAKLVQESGDNALITQAWLMYCQQKLSKIQDFTALLEFATLHRSSSLAQSTVAWILRWEKQTDRAIEMLQVARDQSPKDTEIALAIAACHQEYEDQESAIAELVRIGPDDFPDIAIALADIYEKTGKQNDALKVIQATHKKHPASNPVRYKYARLAADLNLTSIAIYLLDELCSDEPTSVDYWGYLGNACLDAGLYDKALLAYRRAEQNQPPTWGGDWIVSNIGNLFENKGLPTEACTYLERALSIDPKSEYAHNRLATALKNKDLEDKEFRKKCVEGLRSVREAVTIPNLITESTQV
jgi:tetratricopeptide (TPR) repeat protein